MWRDGRVESQDFSLGEVAHRMRDEGALLWVDLFEPDHEDLARLAQELGLSPHAVEDAVASGERPKATRYPSHTFVSVYATRVEAGGDPTSGGVTSRVRTSRVSAFVLPRAVVTVRRDRGFDIDAVVERWAEGGLLEHGSAGLLHGLLDVVVDGHFDTIQLMDDALELLEDDLFDGPRRSRDVQQRTYRTRKELVELRRVVLPMREVVNAVMHHRMDAAGLDTGLDASYSDLYDHALRASEWTESLRDMVTTVFETSLALQNASLNTVMKKLTAGAAIIAVPTAITGWYGMNVAYPGFGATSGLVASSVAILVGMVGLYAFFRRRDWI